MTYLTKIPFANSVCKTAKRNLDGLMQQKKRNINTMEGNTAGNRLLAQAGQDTAKIQPW